MRDLSREFASVLWSYPAVGSLDREARNRLVVRRILEDGGHREILALGRSLLLRYLPEIGLDATHRAFWGRVARLIPDRPAA